MTLNDVVSRLEKLDEDGLRGLIDVRERQDMRLGLPAILRARTSLVKSGNKDWQQATLDCSNAVLRAVRKNAAGRFDGVGLSAIMSASEEAALAVCARAMLKDAEYLLLVEPVAKICAHELLDIHHEELAPEVALPVLAPAPTEESEDRSKAYAKAKLEELFDEPEVVAPIPVKPTPPKVAVSAASAFMSAFNR